MFPSSLVFSLFPFMSKITVFSIQSFFGEKRNIFKCHNNFLSFTFKAGQLYLFCATVAAQTFFRQVKPLWSSFCCSFSVYVGDLLQKGIMLKHRDIFWELVLCAATIVCIIGVYLSHSNAPAEEIDVFFFYFCFFCSSNVTVLSSCHKTGFYCSVKVFGWSVN